MSGFTRQIRGLGQGTQNPSNSNNITSDNYSYYVRSEEQESYQRKKAAWDPNRAFSNQYDESVKKNRDINASSLFGKDSDASQAPGVDIYKNNGFNLNAGSPEELIGNSSNIYSDDMQDYLISKNGGNAMSSGGAFSCLSTGTFLRVIFFVIVIMFIVIWAVSSDTPRKEKNTDIYYEGFQFQDSY